jgi:hypothetical protein
VGTITKVIIVLVAWLVLAVVARGALEATGYGVRPALANQIGMVAAVPIGLWLFRGAFRRR